jgi:hypothetical protein
MDNNACDKCGDGHVHLARQRAHCMVPSRLFLASSSPGANAKLQLPGCSSTPSLNHARQGPMCRATACSCPAHLGEAEAWKLLSKRLTHPARSEQ